MLRLLALIIILLLDSTLTVNSITNDTLFNTVNKTLRIKRRSELIQNDENIFFDVPDLLFDSPKDNLHLEAFRTKNNDEILRSSNPDKYSQLQWVSIGRPTLIKSAPKNNPNSSHLFRFSNRGFYVFVQMLTDDHKVMLKDLVKRKLGLNVDSSQFATLIPAKFECIMKLVNDDGDEFIIKGSVHDPRSFPIKLVFDAKVTTIERASFEDILEKNGDNLDEDIRCEVSSNGRVSRQNTLTISSSQMNRLGITESLFGPASEKFVTRNQMSALASDIYTRLNIIEDYEIPQTEFSKSFVDDFIRQTSESQVFKEVPFDESIKMLSNYALDIRGDLKADVLKSEMSKIFSIDKSDEKERLIVNTEHYGNSSDKSAISLGIGGSGGFKFITASTNYSFSKEKSSGSQTSNKN